MPPLAGRISHASRKPNWRPLDMVAGRLFVHPFWGLHPFRGKAANGAHFAPAARSYWGALFIAQARQRCGVQEAAKMRAKMRAKRCRKCAQIATWSHRIAEVAPLEQPTLEGQAAAAAAPSPWGCRGELLRRPSSKDWLSISLASSSLSSTGSFSPTHSRPLRLPNRRPETTE